MSAQPPFTRLVAIALLNMADDEGFFEADAMLIRGDVFPYLDDYGSITVALRELSGIGFVVVVDHPGKGPIGRVINFLRHQVINKPGRSRLRPLFEAVAGSDQTNPTNSQVLLNSGSATVALPDESRPEMELEMELEMERENPYGVARGNGESDPDLEKSKRKAKTEAITEKALENGKRPRKAAAATFDPSAMELPATLDCEIMRTAWKMWIEHRAQIKKPITEHTARQNMAMLARLSPAAAYAAVARTIAKQWPGVQPCPAAEFHLYRPDGGSVGELTF